MNCELRTMVFYDYNCKRNKTLSVENTEFLFIYNSEKHL